MRIQHLHIKKYKSLKDFTIKFNEPVSLFIGKNGSGKSTLLEAIAWIFRSAHLTYVEEKQENTPFEFEITYELRIEKVLSESTTFSETAIDHIGVILKGSRDNKKFWSIETDNNAYSIDDLLRKHTIVRLLPSNLIIYYAGWFESMEFICSEHERIYKERLLEVKTESDITTSSEELYSRIGALPLMYIEKHHFEILLASLYSFEFNERVDRFFAEDLKIIKPDINPLALFVKKRQWKSGVGAEDFWGARGLLRGFLDVVRRFAYNETANYMDEDQILFNFHIHDWYALREFYGEEKKLFYLLHMLHASEMLGGIQIFMDLQENAISHHDLSEGQQQLITIKAINELLVDENSLLLLDEPDTYLHPQWQSSFLKGIYEVINLYNDLAVSPPQFIIASHSTIMLSNLSTGDLFKMSDGQANPIDKGYYGREYGFNLSAIMGGNERVPEVQEEIDALFELIDSEQFERAVELLEGLKQKHKDDPELTRAETMLTFLKGE
ncbi:AAA family ATPase [Mucilaginibacter auburnensis]|uniref:AAA ATPase-like protein n=1 Tax=Mucilaginibacter auburnensis TaxID=1457233 RepID=A0A2H9VLJ1_9SPHI|nr:AAA family ATPase [Mucilaginibacter auburnensis]PJJ79200.1 AAA ATPase-like protein [Mucilaginibacter auburnensis]